MNEWCLLFRSFYVGRIHAKYILPVYCHVQRVHHYEQLLIHGFFSLYKVAGTES